MIENKIITIKKSTTFDKGWALVTPYQGVFSRNRKFCALSVSDIVRAITKSTRVNLILSEPCLSSQIVKELEWANKYITLNLIANSQDIEKCYPQLKFNKAELDENIDFNYIAVKGKTDLFAIISEDVVAADESVNQVYFENKKVNTRYDFLTKAKSVIFIDKNNDKDYKKLLDACLEFNIPTANLVVTAAYKKELVDKFKGENVKLLCSDNVRNGILYLAEGGKVYCVHLTNRGVLIPIEIENAEYYTGFMMESLMLDDVVNVSDIPQGSCVCNGCCITSFKIVKEKVIERTVQINKMEDFVAEKFDRSETDNFNQYCTEAAEVVYKFTLIPPLFDTTVISNIYADARAVYSKWQENLKTVSLSEIIACLKDLQLNESGLCLLCEEIIAFDRCLGYIFKNDIYKSYYTEVNSMTELVNYSTVEEYGKELFLKLNAENSETKFDRFDSEIAGYRQTIEEKKALIEKGIEVLSNKRRVEILEKKISDLMAMKQRFSGSASVRDNKQLEAFLAFCNQVISGKYVEEKREVDSIGNVLATKVMPKIVKLESFIKTYWHDFNMFLVSVKDLLVRFSAVNIPTEYTVYEQNGERVIAIENEQQYYDTKEIRKHFNLHCRVWR